MNDWTDLDESRPLGTWHQAHNGPENKLLSDAEIGAQLSTLRNDPAARRQLAACLWTIPDARRAERRRKLLRLVMCAAIGGAIGWSLIFGFFYVLQVWAGWRVGL